MPPVQPLPMGMHFSGPNQHAHSEPIPFFYLDRAPRTQASTVRGHPHRSEIFSQDPLSLVLTGPLGCSLLGPTVFAGQDAQSVDSQAVMFSKYVMKRERKQAAGWSFPFYSDLKLLKYLRRKYLQSSHKWLSSNNPLTSLLARAEKLLTLPKQPAFAEQPEALQVALSAPFWLLWKLF